MNDPIIIEPEQLQVIVDRAISKTLTVLGIKARTINPWISQNKAYRLAGRTRVDTAMKKGTVRWIKKDMDNPRGRVMVNLKDIEKLLRDPYL